MEVTQTEVEAFVIATVREVLDLPDREITPESDLRELPGVESIKLLRVISKVEKRYGVELDDDVIFDSSTIAQIAAAIESAAAARAG
jgi:acyl carrier protein